MIPKPNDKLNFKAFIYFLNAETFSSTNPLPDQPSSKVPLAFLWKQGIHRKYHFLMKGMDKSFLLVVQVILVGSFVYQRNAPLKCHLHIKNTSFQEFASDLEKLKNIIFITILSKMCFVTSQELTCWYFSICKWQ